MADRPLILITNDDGIDSPGLHAAVEAMIDLGELLVVAPSYQQTSTGRSYSHTATKTIDPVQIPLEGCTQTGYKVDASPAQAVALTVWEIATRPIDLCISGINYGENLGSGVTISGTVGAALEAACSGIPALAVSFETPQEFHLVHGDVDFGVAAYFTRYFAAKVLEQGLPPQVDLLKIDVPASATTQTGWRSARVSRRRYYQPTVREDGVEDDNRFSYRAVIDPERVEPSSDIYAFGVDRLVTVAPMTFDLTAPVDISEITAFFKSG